MARYPSRVPEGSSAAQGGVIAVDRALSLLKAFQAGDTALTLNDLTGRSQLVKSTVLRMLVSLVHFGLIQKLPDGRYCLGVEIARLHGIYVDAFSLESYVMPCLQQLVQATRESASFHVRQGDQRLVLYRVNSPQPVTDQGRQGDLLSLKAGTGGKVLQAFGPDPAQGAVFDQIRRDGVIALQGDRVADLSGVSSPVFGADGKLVGALTLTVPTVRYAPTLIDVVRAHAQALTQALGGTFPPARAIG